MDTFRNISEVLLGAIIHRPDDNTHYIDLVV